MTDQSQEIFPSQILSAAHNVSIQNTVIINSINNVYSSGPAVLPDKLLDFIDGSAFHDSEARHGVPKCSMDHPVVVRILKWLEMESDEESAVMWLHGAKDSGKSVIAQTVAEHCAASSTLAACFFFSDTRPDSGKHFVMTLASQVVTYTILDAASHDICETLKRDPIIIFKNLEVQMQRLLIDALEQETLYNRNVFLIIIDGLNECYDPSVQLRIIHFILTHFERCGSYGRYSRHSRYKFLITSQRTENICKVFDSFAKTGIVTQFSLDESTYPVELLPESASRYHRTANSNGLSLGKESASLVQASHSSLHTSSASHNRNNESTASSFNRLLTRDHSQRHSQIQNEGVILNSHRYFFNLSESTSVPTDVTQMLLDDLPSVETLLRTARLGKRDAIPTNARQLFSNSNTTASMTSRYYSTQGSDSKKNNRNNPFLPRTSDFGSNYSNPIFYNPVGTDQETSIIPAGNNSQFSKIVNEDNRNHTMADSSNISFNPHDIKQMLQESHSLSARLQQLMNASQPGRPLSDRRLSSSSNFATSMTSQYYETHFTSRKNPSNNPFLSKRFW
ncbi:hypothetical protein BDQ17DRAFT_758475 [Cyathus striatus]|nr:hypothetical protein BDQ17DRAFT_758475 [Cyathus striatus]